VQAAERFARQGGVPRFRPPVHGWTSHGGEAQGVTLLNGTWSVHTVQGPDRTWQVDSARCVDR
jgi:hypothetical protein